MNPDLAGPLTKPEIVKDKRAYTKWNKAHGFCMVCGIPAAFAEKLRWPGLETHHIIKSGRSDDAANLLRTCKRDHDLCEGHSIRGENGELLPNLTMGMILTIKQLRDPEAWNPERLHELRGQALPDLEPCPAVFLLEFDEWQQPALPEYVPPPKPKPIPTPKHELETIGIPAHREPKRTKGECGNCDGGGKVCMMCRKAKCRCQPKPKLPCAMDCPRCKGKGNE